MIFSPALPLSDSPARHTWRILTTPPLSGQENMDYDRATLRAVEAGALPTLRFFRFREPTVTFGRLQTLENIRPLVPAGWPAVQRPTGGGVVFHHGDLCLSLCWREGQAPIPRSVRQQYHWIHSVILEAFRSLPIRMAGCQDCSTSAAFATRDCFTNPVGYDLLLQNQKVVGGALARQRRAALYQGSLRNLPHGPMDDWESRLQIVWQKTLSPLVTVS